MDSPAPNRWRAAACTNVHKTEHRSGDFAPSFSLHGHCSCLPSTINPVACFGARIAFSKAFLLQPPQPHTVEDCRELCRRNETCAAWEALGSSMTPQQSATGCAVCFRQLRYLLCFLIGHSACIGCFHTDSYCLQRLTLISEVCAPLGDGCDGCGSSNCCEILPSTICCRNSSPLTCPIMP